MGMASSSSLNVLDMLADSVIKVQYLGVDYKNLSAIVAILEDYEVKSVINLLGLNGE